MSINRLEHTRYTRASEFELICDVCGEVGVSQGSFKDCVAYAKENKWKSKATRTTNSFARFQWVHYCEDCC
jgi:hypothetical protein